MNIFQKIKTLFAVKNIVSDAQKEIKTMDGVKPGWKTSEFWGKTLVQGVILYNSFLHKNIDPQLAMQAVSVIEGLYHALRAVVKVGHNVKDAFKKADPPAVG